MTDYKKILSFIIALFILTLPFSCANKKDAFTVTSKNGLVLRSEPSSKSERMALIGYNKPVEFLESSDRIETLKNITAPWFRVKYKNKIGWVYSGYLSHKSSSNAKNFWNGTWKAINRPNEKPYTATLNMEKDKYEFETKKDGDLKAVKQAPMDYDGKKHIFTWSLASLSNRIQVEIAFINGKTMLMTEISEDYSKAAVTGSSSVTKKITYTVYKKIE